MLRVTRSDTELVEFFALVLHQACRKRLLALVAVEVNGPVFTRLEFFDFQFAFNNQAQRRALYASGGQPRTDLAPQQRRQIEAHQVIQHTPRLLRIHQRHGDFSRIIDSVLNGALGDFVKFDARDRFLRRDLFLAQDFREMPGNSFSLAIRVSCQQDAIRLFCRTHDGVDVFFVALDELVLHRELVIRIHRTGFRYQVAHVTVAGEDFVILAEIFFQGFCLGRRLDNNEK